VSTLPPVSYLKCIGRLGIILKKIDVSLLFLFGHALDQPADCRVVQSKIPRQFDLTVAVLVNRSAINPFLSIFPVAFPKSSLRLNVSSNRCARGISLALGQ
jgi:hypothetical protein